MEVHHPRLNHSSKPWKEYFIEALMIFIAVTMGFFAEGLRENINNKERVKHLCGLLVQDLGTDTARMRQLADHQTFRSKKCDSLFMALRPGLGKIDGKRVQHLVLECYGSAIFNASTGTIEAIKKEYHLKQFSQSDLSMRIAKYETWMQSMKVQELKLDDLLKTTLEPFIKDHFTPENIYNFYISKDEDAVDSKLRNITQNDLDQLGVGILFYKGFIRGHINLVQGTKDDVTSLIAYIHKEFHPND